MEDLNLADVGTHAPEGSSNEPTTMEIDGEEDANSDTTSDSDDDIPLADLHRKNVARSATPLSQTYTPPLLPPVPASPNEAATQTGGVPGAGRRVIKAKPKKKEPTLGDEVSKMKILLPLFKGLSVKANLRHLVMAKAGLEAF